MGSSLGVRALKVIVKVLAWMAVPIVIALTLVAVVTQMPERRTPPNADVVRSLDSTDVCRLVRIQPHA